MKPYYLVSLESSKNQIVNVILSVETNQDLLRVFLPVWSPGSYMVREYARHLQIKRITNESGRFVEFEREDKSHWIISTKGSVSVSIEYEVYAHELTVRTSHVTSDHAFLHGPSYLLGVEGAEKSVHEIELKIPKTWQKISTALKDISKEREKFLYHSKNYDELIDTPIEAGSHQTDGFMAGEVPHGLAWFGRYEGKSLSKLKEDIKTLVETVQSYFGEVPFDNYEFITHSFPGIYGGLEHLNSTALQFDGLRLGERKQYLMWLGLVAHEYFHSWNVKRIRPKELGPFDYSCENMTTMLWLAEGLTSFIDDWTVYRSGLCSFDEYLEIITKNINRLMQTPGRRFDSLEESSFLAWIKLYRPHENSNNNTVSYYLKGGIVFLLLHLELVKVGKSSEELLRLLWESYKSNPESGITTLEVFKLIETIGNQEIREKFSTWVETTEDLPIEKSFKEHGMSFSWKKSSEKTTGAHLKNENGKIVISSVPLGSASYKAGLSPGDEIICVDDIRVESEKISSLIGQKSKVTIGLFRNKVFRKIEVLPDSSPRTLEKIEVPAKEKAFLAFGSENFS